MLILVDDPPWTFVKKRNYLPGSILRNLKDNLRKGTAPLVTQLPRPVVPSEDPSDRSKPPKRQPLFSAFYKDLVAGFKASQNHNEAPSNEQRSKVKITPRTFDVCWTKSDPYELRPVWGKVIVKEEEMSLTRVEDRKTRELISALYVGCMDDYPLSSASVYYCYDNDMIYIYIAESSYMDNPTPYYPVHPFWFLAAMVAEFS